MGVLEEFQKWYKDHTGHPADIKFAKEAIDELEQENEDLKHRVKDLSTCVEVSVSRNKELKKEVAELKGLNAAYRLAYDLEKLTDEELQIFKVENKETIEKLFKLLNK